ncbi:hypothetical protein NN561_002502 [Cricetulus griseus]
MPPKSERLCPPGRAGHAGCPPRDSRSAKFVPLSLRSSGTGRSPRQELRRSYLGGEEETAWRWPASQLLPGSGQGGGGGGSRPAGLEELKGRDKEYQPWEDPETLASRSPERQPPLWSA